MSLTARSFRDMSFYFSTAELVERQRDQAYLTWKLQFLSFYLYINLRLNYLLNKKGKQMWERKDLYHKNCGERKVLAPETGQLLLQGKPSTTLQPDSNSSSRFMAYSAWLIEFDVSRPTLFNLLKLIFHCCANGGSGRRASLAILL